MKKIIAVNGGPRKNANTMAMLNKFIDGIKATQPDTEVKVIHLYDYLFRGCYSCYACKRKGKTYGAGCAIKDEASPLFEEIVQADGLVIGTPIYFSSVTGQLQSFLERLVYPYLSYAKEREDLTPKRFPVTMIYTMNANPDQFVQYEMAKTLAPVEFELEMAFSKPEVVYAFNTYQFKDYSKYHAEIFPEPYKRQWRDEEFPKELEAAYQAGVKMTEKVYTV